MRLRPFVSFRSAFSVWSADAATVVVAPLTLRTRLKVNRQKRTVATIVVVVPFPPPPTFFAFYTRPSVRRLDRRQCQSSAVAPSHVSLVFVSVERHPSSPTSRYPHDHRLEYFRKSSKSVSDRLYTWVCARVLCISLRLSSLRVYRDLATERYVISLVSHTVEFLVEESRHPCRSLSGSVCGPLLSYFVVRQHLQTRLSERAPRGCWRHAIVLGLTTADVTWTT